jgi:hypothetical protein
MNFITLFSGRERGNDDAALALVRARSAEIGQVRKRALFTNAEKGMTLLSSTYFFPQHR